MHDALDRFGDPPEGGEPLPCHDRYYVEMSLLTHAILRRAWIAEGRRRGYVLEDA